MELSQEQQLFAAVVQKAWEDPHFKQALIDSPETAIQAATGQSFEVQEGTKLVVNDQSNPDYVYLNIPPRPNYDDIELTDEQLELVSGGEFILTTITIVGTATIISGIVSYTVASPPKEKKVESAQ